INKDIYIVSFDGLEEGQLFYPQLTTIAQPIKEISRVLIDTLMLRINKQDYKQDIVVSHYLIEGQTCL
ncbi:MAG: substrate-binding domain-containing protein, partial [Bacilli bacterium]